MWARLLSIVLGLWTMASPNIWNYSHNMSNNNHVVGPLIITFATIALWDINRNVRLVNIVTGAWLAVSVFILPTDSAVTIASNVITGLLIIIFSLVKGKTSNEYGGGWASLFQHHPSHLIAAEKESAAQE